MDGRPWEGCGWRLDGSAIAAESLLGCLENTGGRYVQQLEEGCCGVASCLAMSQRSEDSRAAEGNMRARRAEAGAARSLETQSAQLESRRYGKVYAWCQVLR